MHDKLLSWNLIKQVQTQDASENVLYSSKIYRILSLGYKSQRTIENTCIAIALTFPLFNRLRAGSNPYSPQLCMAIKTFSKSILIILRWTSLIVTWIGRILNVQTGIKQCNNLLYFEIVYL